MKVIKSFDINKSSAISERRFRASIYVDIFVPETEDLETDRESAKIIAQELVDDIPFNAYIGGIAFYNPSNILKPLDKEI